MSNLEDQEEILDKQKSNPNASIREMLAQLAARQEEMFESLTTRIGQIELEQERLKKMEERVNMNEESTALRHTPKKKDNERRSSLATRDLGKLLERGQDLQVIHTPQSFKLNAKLGDILKFSDYRELVQQVKRFKTRPGNAEVEIYLYRDEYMNDALRSWTLTRLHLYYGSERARASGEDHQFTSADLTNMESLEFLVVLERVFISTNKDEYRRFFKKIVEEGKQRASCKTLTMSSVRYLIADFEIFQELIDDALVVNPEKVRPEDKDLGLWHPGLKYNKNLDEEGMLTTVMEWFPPQLMKTIRSRMVGESKIQTIAEWIRNFKVVLQEFATVEAKYHDILVSVTSTTNTQKGTATVRREMQKHDRSGYIHNIEQEEQSPADAEINLPDQQDDTPGIGSEKEDSGEDILEEEFEEKLNNLTGRPFPKKVEDRRAGFNKPKTQTSTYNWLPRPDHDIREEQTTNEDPCMRHMSTGKCDNTNCRYSHDHSVINKWIDAVKGRLENPSK